MTLRYHTWLLAAALVSIPAFIVVCIYSYVERKRAQDESWTGKPIVLTSAGRRKAGVPAVFAQGMKKVKGWVGRRLRLMNPIPVENVLLAQGPGTSCVHAGWVWRRCFGSQSEALRWPQGSACRFIENTRGSVLFRVLVVSVIPCGRPPALAPFLPEPAARTHPVIRLRFQILIARAAV